ncbi:MAG TPA: ribonuclease HI family protein [Bacteroidota bacterium]|nr:ribonuclease HI family protein [Bacteroidota bacterium]
MKVLGYTDGAARGNPGPGGVGILLKDEAGGVLLREKKYLGKVTNNVAEYTALIECLRHVRRLGEGNGIRCTSLLVHSDSELLVRQLKGEYKVKDAVLKELHQEVRTLLDSSTFEFAITHVPRELNREADALANESIDEHASG